MLILVPSLLATITWILVGWYALRWARRHRKWYLWGLGGSALYIGGVSLLLKFMNLIRGLSFDWLEALEGLHQTLYGSLSRTSPLGIVAHLIFGVSFVLFALRIQPEDPHPPELPDASAAAQPD